MTTTINSRSGEKGFTLVELSIVMIIIGLLIGGILKGQELIANARLASAVSKVKAIDAAMNTFRDTYSALPGDIPSPSTRLPNCLTSTTCGDAAVAGNGNGQIGIGPGLGQSKTTENMAAWAQLSAADMIGGVQNGPAGGNVIPGQSNPNAELPGQLYLGYSNGTVLTSFTGPTSSIRAGHYILLHNGAAAVGTATTAPAAAATTSITPNQALRIDTKLDDGLPNTGSALAMGTVNPTTGCAAANTTDAAGVYSTANQGVGCGIYVRIQQ